MAKTIVVCQACGREEEYTRARESGWLIASHEYEEGAMTIWCPECKKITITLDLTPVIEGRVDILTYLNYCLIPHGFVLSLEEPGAFTYLKVNAINGDAKSWRAYRAALEKEIKGESR